MVVTSNGTGNSWTSSTLLRSGDSPSRERVSKVLHFCLEKLTLTASAGDSLSTIDRLSRGDFECDRQNFANTKGCRQGKQKVAFEKLKSLLTTAPVLAYPTFGSDSILILETDASRVGLSAVLSQKQSDNHVHPIAYASRSLNPH